MRATGRRVPWGWWVAGAALLGSTGTAIVLGARGRSIVRMGVPNDGSADAAAPLQALLNAARPGSAFFAPPGTYLILTPVQVPSGIALTGTPTSRFVTTASANLPGFFQVTGDSVTLTALTLVGNNLAGVGVDATLAPVANLTVQNCLITQMQAAGIQVGYNGTPCTDVKILSNSLVACAFPLSALYDCDGVQFVGNVALSSPQRGIMLNLGNASGPRNVLIQANRIEAQAHTGALSIEGANAVQVVNNQWISWHGIFGFYCAFTGQSAQNTNVVIKGNSFAQMTPSTGFCGVFGAANGIQLTGNQFSGFYGGLGADSNCRSGNVVSGNRFSGLSADYEGTWLQGGWTFSGNTGISAPPFVAG